MNTTSGSDERPGLAPPVTVCVLCYGDHPELARRVLSSLARFTVAHAFRLRLGLNAVSERTWAEIHRLLPHFDVEVLIRSDENLYKVPMMRRLFHDRPLTTPWVIWFDDDSFVERCDWLDVLSCQSQLQPNIDMWGQRLFMRVDDQYRSFISSSPWFRGLALETDEQPATYRLNFIAGGFWALRSHWLHQLRWPDERLLHFGDDYLLGEALRQNGGSLGQCISGIAINQCSRRAPAGTPQCHVLH